MKWETIDLGEIIDIKHGYAFKSEGYSDAGDLVLLTPGNCDESGGLKLKGDKERYYIGEFPPEFLLNEGDMLVVMTDLINTAPILGGSFVIPESNKFLHNQRLGLVQTIDEPRIDQTFLYFLLNTFEYRAQVRGSASGATVRHTSPGRIKACKVRIPRDVAYQRRVGKILSAYGDLIENNRRRMALLEDAARQLYREWFVRLRFPGYEHTTRSHGIPDGWKRLTIGDYIERGCITLQTGPFGTQLKASEYVDAGTPVINVRNIGFGEIRSEKLEFVPENVAEKLDIHILKAGDIVFGRKGAVDRHALIHTNQVGWMQGSDCIRLRAHSEEVSPIFVSFGLREQSHRDWILAQCSNKATMASLNQDVISRISVIEPDRIILRQFDEFGSEIVRQQAKLQQQTEKAIAARDLLLPRLMSGEIAI